MNYDREVRWAMRALSILDRVRTGMLTDRQRRRLVPALVEKRLNWLEDYRDQGLGMVRSDLRGPSDQ